MLKFVNSEKFNFASKTLLKTYLKGLEDYWSKFQEYQCLIEALSGKEEIEFQVQEMLEAETVFFQAKSRILEKMTEEIAAMPQIVLQHQGYPKHMEVKLVTMNTDI